MFKLWWQIERDMIYTRVPFSGSSHPFAQNIFKSGKNGAELAVCVARVDCLIHDVIQLMYARIGKRE